MTRRKSLVSSKGLFRASCWLYSRLLLLHPDALSMRYGEEMQWVFREELKRAAHRGPRAYMVVWSSVLRETALQIGPLVILRAGILSIAVIGTLVILLPLLSAIPTHLPKVDGPCLPRIHAHAAGNLQTVL